MRREIGSCLFRILANNSTNTHSIGILSSSAISFSPSTFLSVSSYGWENASRNMGSVGRFTKSIWNTAQNGAAFSKKMGDLKEMLLNLGIYGRNLSTSPSNSVQNVKRQVTRSESHWRGLRAVLRDYKQLSKFRLSTLVVATAAAGYVAGSENNIDWVGLGWASLGTLLASSSANALNQIYEVVNDSRMRRTAVRPLPAGRLSKSHALVFAILSGISGIYILNEKSNSQTAALGAANIVLYAGVYTPLKQISVINTWIGAVVGAVPPLMGWVAASGSLDVGALILAAGLYFWQMPHFMALAWLCREDYAAGGHRMLSLIDPSGKRTAACALRNCAYLFPLGILSAWLGVTTPYFAYESAFITAGMLLTAARFYSKTSNANARLLFRASLIHLPIFMISFLVHRCPNTKEDRGEMFLRHVRSLGLLSSMPFNGSDAAETNDVLVHNTLPRSDSKIIFLQKPYPGLQSCEKEANSTESWQFHSTRGDKWYHSYVPPLPFLPIPRLELDCPSRVECLNETDNKMNDDLRNPPALHRQVIARNSTTKDQEPP